MVSKFMQSNKSNAQTRSLEAACVARLVEDDDVSCVGRETSKTIWKMQHMWDIEVWTTILSQVGSGHTRALGTPSRPNSSHSFQISSTLIGLRDGTVKKSAQSRSQLDRFSSPSSLVLK